MFIRHILFIVPRPPNLTKKTNYFYGPDVSNPIFEEYSFAKISNLKEQNFQQSNYIYV